MAEEGIKTGDIHLEAGASLAIGSGATAATGGLTANDAGATRRYLEWLKTTTRHLPLDGLGDPTLTSTRAELHAIYTALLARQLSADFERTQMSKLRSGKKAELAIRSALELVDEVQYLVLLGDPGSGKSTFVDFLSLCLAGHATNDPDCHLGLLRRPLPEDDGSPAKSPQKFRHENLLPLHLVLRQLDLDLLGASAASLFAAIKADLTAKKLEDFAAPLERRLDCGEVLVIFDGLDEVAFERRAQLAQAIESFRCSFSRCRFLVTSRPIPYRSHQDFQLKKFEEAELQVFSRGQIQVFIRAWYGHVAAERALRFTPEQAAARATRLIAAVLATDRRGLYELAERPLLLTMIAIVDAWGQQLPEQRHELYERTIQLLFEVWESRRQDATAVEKTWVLADKELTAWFQANRAGVRAKLEQLAFEAHAAQPDLEGPAAIRLGRWLELLNKLAGDFSFKRLNEYLRERAGLLLAKDDQRDDVILYFPHRSFQEYLAARFLNDCEELRLSGEVLTAAQLARRDPDRWREVILLAAAAKGARSDLKEKWAFVRELQESAVGALDHELAVIAGEALVEAIAAHPKTAKQNATATVEVPTWEDLEAPRRRTLDAVAADLQRAMKSEARPLVRVRAGKALGRLLDPRFYGPELFCLPRAENLGFLKVDAGAFVLGSRKEVDPMAADDELPPQTLPFLGEFWIARYPVTVAQLHCFVEAKSGTGIGQAALRGESHEPAVALSFLEACAYAAWLDEGIRSTGLVDIPEGFNVRLPTEEEWEKAARGPEGRIWPWPGDFDARRANTFETEIKGRSVVGSFFGGRSFFEAEEMAGNVREWTLSPWRSRYDLPFPDKKSIVNATRVVRGGSYFDARSCVRCAFRGHGHPSGRSDDIGFRLVLAPFSLASVFL